MAGYPGTHGGARAGGGRKRKTLEQRVLEGTVTQTERSEHAEHVRETASQDADDTPETSASRASDYVPMPMWLRPDEKRIWTELAPLAIAAHTLTPQTAVGFRTLVETRAARLKLRRIIEREGYIVRKKGPNKGKRHPLLTEHRNMLTLETTAMLRFRLHAAGQEMDFVPPTPTEGAKDQWSEFDTPATPSLATGLTANDDDEDATAH